MRRFHSVLLALGGGLLVYLLWKIGPRELWREFALLGWGVVPLMLGEGIAEMIHTVGWRHCLTGPNRSLPWRTLFGIRMAGYAINYLTPTAALGGEVTKGALLSSYHRGPEAASAILIGKLCFALAHLLFVIIGGLLLFPALQLPGPFWKAMLGCGVLVGTGMLIFFYLQLKGKLGAVFRWLAGRRSEDHPLQKAAAEFTAVDNVIMQFFKERPFDIFMAIGWHLVGYSVGIGQTWLLFRLLHQKATWTLAASAWFLGMGFDLLTFAIPLNLGTLEATRIVALRALGYRALMGMTYGFAFRLAQIFWACFGLVSYAFLFSRVRTATPAGAVREAPATASDSAATPSEKVTSLAHAGKERQHGASQIQPLNSSPEIPTRP